MFAVVIHDDAACLVCAGWGYHPEAGGVIFSYRLVRGGLAL